MLQAAEEIAREIEENVEGKSTSKIKEETLYITQSRGAGTKRL